MRNDLTSLSEIRAVIGRGKGLVSFYPLALTLTNPGAETGDGTGWSVLGAQSGGGSTGGVAHSGSFNFKHPQSAGSEGQQDVSIPESAEADIDAGGIRAELRAWQAGWDGDGDRGRLKLYFLDSGGVQIGSEIGGYESKNGTWEERVLAANIPAGTRTIRIGLHGDRTSGTNNDVYWDDVSLILAVIPPSNVTAIWDPENEEVDVDWIAAPGASSHEVHRSATEDFTPGPSTLVDTLGGAATSYSDNGAQDIDSQNVFYKVVAVVDGSDYASAEVSLYVPATGHNFYTADLTALSGNPPPDWTIQWGQSGGFNFSGSSGFVRGSTPSGSQGGAAGWDVPPQNIVDGMVRARVFDVSTLATQHAFMRGSGTSGDIGGWRTGYSVAVRQDNSDLWLYRNGSIIASLTKSLSGQCWIELEVVEDDVNDSTWLRVRAWRTSESRPSDPDIQFEDTDGSRPTAGWAGLGTFSTNVNFYEIEVETYA